MSFPKQPDKLGELIPDLLTRCDIEKSFIDENYDRLAFRITMLWGSQECLDELQSLAMYDYTERGTRSGFPSQVINELTELLHIHMDEFPNIDNEWSVTFRKDIW